MDNPLADKEILLQEIKHKLDERCMIFDANPNLEDELAMCSEHLLDTYLINNSIEDDVILNAIHEREVFPCHFGSALKLQGINSFLNLLDKYTIMPKYSEDFSARIYKIGTDAKKNRLTYMKITGGTLKMKDSLLIKEKLQKINQIRIYSGVKFINVAQVTAGEICAVVGLENTKIGDTLGSDNFKFNPIMLPEIDYIVLLPPKYDPKLVLQQLRILEEQDPQLNLVWNEQDQTIFIRIMGEMQLQILQTIIRDRFSIDIDFAIPIETTIDETEFTDTEEWIEEILNEPANFAKKNKLNQDRETIGTEEIDIIINRMAFSNSGKKSTWNRPKQDYYKPPTTSISTIARQKYLLIDGYNMMFSWGNLKELTEVAIDAARSQFLDVICNYRGVINAEIIVVFDAYKKKTGEVEQKYNNITVVYTKENQTADQYIERFANKYKDKYNITVATSDSLQQTITRTQGATVMSSRDLRMDIDRQIKNAMEKYGTAKPERNFIGDLYPESTQ
ncbi:hypothetical protein AN639_00835 [Candidatus Epulonipiscium fishelsonii]|uniref:Uncharacterized protein n=1 Tax=Candidatus Epulonipiscium fishelsonii TaxID=77094 RepID=A0ACC8X7N0_9FIRM|nr:hypothetical protein AN396_12320 [Epulopiscium sp. SCG-B11WGA-EpuloA1]ONI41343.1 hypothetical protein AN639_00835 [Epulopiscium sp. SCG-B05WGA-EpuloA1]